MFKKPKVAVIMGSDSDFSVVKKAIYVLKKFEIEFEVSIISAHRTPFLAMEYAQSAEDNGFEVIIAAAGKAAHLPGVLAAMTCIPVIGIPIKSSTLDGMDSLLSIVQMPTGIPVATVAIDGAENAAILAAQMLSLKYVYLKENLKKHKDEMKENVVQKNINIKMEEY